MSESILTAVLVSRDRCARRFRALVFQDPKQVFSDLPFALEYLPPVGFKGNLSLLSIRFIFPLLFFSGDVFDVSWDVAVGRPVFELGTKIG